MSISRSFGTSTVEPYAVELLIALAAASLRSDHLTLSLQQVLLHPGTDTEG
jgi:hypothetical protein